jgi:hypothetical protein
MSTVRARRANLLLSPMIRRGGVLSAAARDERASRADRQAGRQPSSDEIGTQSGAGAQNCRANLFEWHSPDQCWCALRRRRQTDHHSTTSWFTRAVLHCARPVRYLCCSERGPAVQIGLWARVAAAPPPHCVRRASSSSRALVGGGGLRRPSGNSLPRVVCESAPQRVAR